MVKGFIYLIGKMLDDFILVRDDNTASGTMPAVWLRIAVYKAFSSCIVRFVLRISGYFNPGWLTLEVG